MIPANELESPSKNEIFDHDDPYYMYYDDEEYGYNNDMDETDHDEAYLLDYLNQYYQ